VKVRSLRLDESPQLAHDFKVRPGSKIEEQWARLALERIKTPLSQAKDKELRWLIIVVITAVITNYHDSRLVRWIIIFYSETKMNTNHRNR